MVTFYLKKRVKGLNESSWTTVKGEFFTIGPFWFLDLSFLLRAEAVYLPSVSKGWYLDCDIGGQKHRFYVPLPLINLSVHPEHDSGYQSPSLFLLPTPQTSDLVCL